MNRRTPPGTIAVVGGGQVALLAACALARTLPIARVRLLPTAVPPHAMADRAHGALPSLARLHDRIGIDEAGLLARAGASHRLATRHGGGWRSDGSDWWIGHGAVADPAAHGWTGRDTTGATAPSGPAVALALAERFAPAADDPASPLSDIDHGLRWAPEAYRRHLASLARHLGVAIEAAGDTVPDAVDADLVIDATGQRGDDWIDWSDDLPIDRVTIAHADPALSVADHVTLDDTALHLISPGRDATRRVTMRHGGEGNEIASGRRRSPWTGRIVALGDAAALLPPLGHTNLALAAQAIDLLVELLPGRDIHPLERAEYNRRAGQAADAARDFVAAHLVALPEGHRLRSQPSPLLALRLREFARRARLPYVEEDFLPRDLWTQLLTGIGIPPGTPAHLAAADPAVTAAARTAQAQRSTQAVALAEPYPLWLARTLGERG
ncbi:tryptophan 7-halogenase [Sphingomonas sp. Leaf4]|uniref:tryptophan 7-halogenase n=1 Tax=Sphingomonas sp. Leaf4 TaxID=2876553 RepID=UPI001E51A7B6|nr:tryptophan 7-halogenase [Sphingomonas sp. Leaf4]